ncbi:MAG: VWA domain-containing protein [Acidobacteriota bacterium]
MSTRVALTGAALLLWGGLVAAQQQASPTGPRAFRVDVEAVEIDVRVVDQAGRPVTGLTRDDFEVFDEGVRQQVRAFTPVEAPVVHYPARIAEPDVASNERPFDGRLYLIVLDDLHTHPLRTASARRAVRAFLEEHFAANDRAAIVVTSGRTDVSQELTGSRPALLAAVDRFTGRKLRSSTLERLDEYYLWHDVRERREPGERIDDPLEYERARDARMALDTLTQASRWLAGVPARRKALLYVSEGIDYDIHDVFENKEATSILAASRDAVAAAARGNVTIYGIDPRGLTQGDEGIEVASLPQEATIQLGPTTIRSEVQRGQDSLRTLADQTGGFALVNVNDLAAGFRRIVEDNSHYYLLGYEPTNTKRDGRFRRIEVKVKRPGVTVHARPGYQAPSDRRRAAVTEQPAGALGALLESPLPVPGLTLSGHAAAFRGDGGQASTLLTLELAPGLVFTSADGVHRTRIDVAAVAIGPDGKATGLGQRALELKLTDEQLAHVTRYGLRTLSRVDLAPGRYQLRVAARAQHGGREGTLVHDLVVPDFAAPPLALSHLVLGSRGMAQPMTGRPDPALVERMAVPPTARRSFDPADALVVFAEVYDNRPQPADGVRIVTTVTGADGRTVVRAEETVEPHAFEPARRSWGHRLDVPLATLAPGQYVLRVDIAPAAGGPGGTARELPFEVRPGAASS